MTKREARLIRALKKRATYRGLTEVYYSPNEVGYGSQSYGEDLCVKAFKVLYPHRHKHPFEYEYGKESESFDEENKSAIGDFYWWE